MCMSDMQTPRPRQRISSNSRRVTANAMDAWSSENALSFSVIRAMASGRSQTKYGATYHRPFGPFPYWG
jgi:hypothetical protein